MDDARELLRLARDELYHARALVAATRNHTKVTTAALADRERAIARLLDRIEGSPTPEGGPGNNGNERLAHTVQ